MGRDLIRDLEQDVAGYLSNRSNESSNSRER